MWILGVGLLWSGGGFFGRMATGLDFHMGSFLNKRALQCCTSMFKFIRLCVPHKLETQIHYGAW